jgi:hypothetical protein
MNQKINPNSQRDEKVLETSEILPSKQFNCLITVELSPPNKWISKNKVIYPNKQMDTQKQRNSPQQTNRCPTTKEFSPTNK